MQKKKIYSIKTVPLQIAFGCLSRHQREDEDDNFAAKTWMPNRQKQNPYRPNLNIDQGRYLKTFYGRK